MKKTKNQNYEAPLMDELSVERSVGFCVSGAENSIEDMNEKYFNW